MREIKFRAWHKYDHKMYRIVNLFLDYEQVEVFDCWTRDLISGETEMETLTLPLGHVELMQWTGLLDTHGKEVYEGDIVEYLDNTSHGLVKKSAVINDIRHMPDFTCSKWEEVVGNIYENGDMLPAMEDA